MKVGAGKLKNLPVFYFVYQIIDDMVKRKTALNYFFANCF